MKKFKIFTAVIILAFLVALSPARAGTKHYTLVSGEKDFYYGFISYLPEEAGKKAPEIFRPGLSQPETARLNFPLAPGDVVVTYDLPCEIQFDSGTIVRLATDTRLKIETIMAQTLSSGDQLSNLFLEKGSVYLMYTAYNSWEIFQLLTPNAALKMKNHTVVLAHVAENGETGLVVREGQGRLLFGPTQEQLKSIAIKKGEALIVKADHQVEKTAGFPELSDFEAWNQELNKNFLEWHKGITPLPKPIQKLPPAVFYFAQNYANKYGQWIWDDFYGYVWRPYYNDVYPWGNWSPYFYGQWTYVNGALFWVPEEPWGWVPYHLGIWQWDKKLGWVWIPGSVFAPAWVDWEFFFGFYSWRPWTMMDWLFYDSFWGSDYYFLTGQLGSGVPVSGGSQLPEIKQINKIKKDQLKKPQTSSLPIPGEYKSILKNLSQAIEKGNHQIIDRISIRPAEPVVIKREDMGNDNLKGKIIPANEVIKVINQEKASQNQKSPIVRNLAAEKLALIDYLRTKTQALTVGSPGRSDQKVNSMPEGKMLAIPRELTGPILPGAKPQQDAAAVSSPGHSNLTFRFRDWNPDLKVAQQLGVHLAYDSARNAVVSPELRLSSREAKELKLRITPSGIVRMGPPAGLFPESGPGLPDSSSTNSSYQPRMSSQEKGAAASASSSGNSSTVRREKN